MPIALQLQESVFLTVKCFYIFCTDIAVTLSQLTSVAFQPDVQTTAGLTIGVENVAAAASGNDVIPVTGADSNYGFRVVFSDSDLATGADSLGLTVVTVSMTSDTKRGLAATATTDFSGLAELVLPAAVCPQVGASWS